MLSILCLPTKKKDVESEGDKDLTICLRLGKNSLEIIIANKNFYCLEKSSLEKLIILIPCT